MRMRFALYSCGLLALPLLLSAPTGAAPATETVHEQFAQKDATIADLRRQIAALTVQVTALKAQAGTSEVNAPNADGMTPLMLAIQSRNLERTELLLAQGADVSALDKGGNTALMLAAQWGQIDVIRALLDKGATVDVKNQHAPGDNGGGATALMWAARYNHVPAVNLLVDRGASMTLGDNGGRGGALFWSGSYGQAAATKALLDRGAPINAKDKDGKTALYWAKRPYPGVDDGARDATVAVLESAGGKE